MEVENKEKKPSLPQNYVSLAQLQERWLEQQQRKKREEEEEKERQRKQKEAEEEERRWRLEEEAERVRRLKEAEEERKRSERDEAERSRLGQNNQIGRNRNGYRRENKESSRGQKPPTNRRYQSGKGFRTIGIGESDSVESPIAVISVDDLSRGLKPPNPINRRNQSIKRFKTIGIDESKSKESPIGVVAVDEEEKKNEDVNGREKKKKNWNKRKPRADKEQAESTELISPENQKVGEQLPAALAKRDDGKSSGSNEIGEQSSEESQVGALPVDNVNEKKKKKKWNKKKARADKELIPPETEKVDEHVPAALAKREAGNPTGRSFRTIGVDERSSEESQIAAISVEGVNEKKNMKKLNRRKSRADKEPSGTAELISPEHEKADEHIPAALAKPDYGKELNGNKFHRNGRTAIDAGSEKKVPVKTWMEKSRAEENITRGRKQLLPEHKKKAEKSLPVGVAEQEDEMGTKIGDQRKGKLLVVVNNNVPRMENHQVDQSSEIGEKLVDLSLNGETRGFKTNAGTTPNRHGYQKKYNGGFGKFSGRRALKSRDPDLVWVRKDNASDSKVAEFGTEARVEPWKAGRKPYR